MFISQSIVYITILRPSILRYNTNEANTIFVNENQTHNCRYTSPDIHIVKFPRRIKHPYLTYNVGEFSVFRQKFFDPSSLFVFKKKPRWSCPIFQMAQHSQLRTRNSFGEDSCYGESIYMYVCMQMYRITANLYRIYLFVNGSANKARYK